MMSNRLLYSAITVALLATSAMSAQTFLTSGIKFVDKASGHHHDWKVSSSATGNQGFSFPSSPGTANQVLKVTSVTNGDAMFGWATGGASVASTSTRLAADVTESAAWDTGPDIPVEANKSYRIVGEFAISRGETGANDKFKLRVNLTSSSDTISYSVECLDCPANSTGVPQSVTGSGTSVQLPDDIDPDGSMEGTVFNYRIEGIVKTKAAGNVRLTFNKSIASEDTVMKANSYWALIEIQ